MGQLILRCRERDAQRRVDADYVLSVSHEWCVSNGEVVSRAMASDVMGVVVDMADEHGSSTAPVIHRLKEVRSDLPVLLWCRPGDTKSPDFASICDAGIDAVLFRRQGDFERRALAQFFPRGRFPSQSWMEEALARRVAPELRVLVAACLDPECIGLEVPQVARRLRRSRRTLAYQLHNAHLPPPGVLLVWGRLLAAAWDLTHTARPVERIAQDRGFASAASLRVALRRRTTDLPRDLRTQEGFGWALRCFEHDLSRRTRNAHGGK